MFGECQHSAIIVPPHPRHFLASFNAAENTMSGPKTQ